MKSIWQLRWLWSGACIAQPFRYPTFNNLAILFAGLHVWQWWELGKKTGENFAIIFKCNLRSVETANTIAKGRAVTGPRPPDRIESDWHYFNYRNTVEIKGVLSFSGIRDWLKEGQPVQAYFQHYNGRSAHVVLITGVYKNDDMDDMLVVTDPLKDKPIFIASLKLGDWGGWQRSWVISK